MKKPTSRPRAARWQHLAAHVTLRHVRDRAVGSGVLEPPSDTPRDGDHVGRDTGGDERDQPDADTRADQRATSGHPDDVARHRRRRRRRRRGRVAPVRSSARSRPRSSSEPCTAPAAGVQASGALDASAANTVFTGVKQRPARAASNMGGVLSNVSPALAASWIAVATAEELGAAPLQVWALGEPWVLARLGPDGAVAAFADRCPHRLAPLSAGEVVEGELRCGYHGWRFGADGGATAIPALGPVATLPPRACLRSVAAVAEHLGLIWIAIEQPLAPLPALSASDGLDALVARCEIVRTPVSAVQLIDNFMDAAHLPFVHADSFGVPDAFEVSNDRIVRDDWLVRSTSTGPYRHHDDPLVATGEHPLVQEHTASKIGYAGCNASLELRFPITDGVFGIVYACQPETATSTRIFKVIARNDVDTGAMERCVKDEDGILQEDLAILERYTSMTVETDLTVEVHTKADRLSVAWRRLMSDMQHHRRHGASRETVLA